jgi:hypothetical protein
VPHYNQPIRSPSEFPPALNARLPPRPTSWRHSLYFTSSRRLAIPVPAILHSLLLLPTALVCPSSSIPMVSHLSYVFSPPRALLSINAILRIALRNRKPRQRIHATSKPLGDPHRFVTWTLAFLIGLTSPKPSGLPSLPSYAIPASPLLSSLRSFSSPKLRRLPGRPYGRLSALRRPYLISFLKNTHTSMILTILSLLLSYPQLPYLPLPPLCPIPRASDSLIYPHPASSAPGDGRVFSTVSLIRPLWTFTSSPLYLISGPIFAPISTRLLANASTEFLVLSRSAS